MLRLGEPSGVLIDLRAQKGILLEGLIKVSEFFFFSLFHTILLHKISERDLVIGAFNSSDAVIKYSCGAIQVIDGRVTKACSHQTEGRAGQSRLLTLHRFLVLYLCDSLHKTILELGLGDVL